LPSIPAAGDFKEIGDYIAQDNGAITAQMHDAGQDLSRDFVFAQLNSAGSPPLDRIPGGHWQDTMTERCAWA
jgi:hypothetical protein